VVPADEAPDEPLARVLARRRARRDEERERTRAEIATIDAELERLQQRRRAAAVELEDAASDGAVVERSIADYLANAVGELAGGVLQARRLRDALEVARMHAIQRTGLPTVQEYEQLRARLREAEQGGDALALKAFRALERERRMTLRELADAWDRADAPAPLRARFFAFAVDGESMIVAAPIAADALGDPPAAALDEVSLAIACSFWQAAERASRELSGAAANIEHGRVAGSLAVRIGYIEPGLLQLLLDETWGSRAALRELQFERSFEVVDGADPAWQAEAPGAADDEAPAVAAAGGAATGGPLPEVAARLSLSLADLVVMLSDRGLPFGDDAIDEGTEETLRALLGEPAAEPAASGVNPEGAPGVLDDVDRAPEAPLGARGVAGRMLRKLLRDRRVGGRHTRIENAYGHHFSDGEKDLARSVAEWLEKDGILMPKLNEGSHHISINPRRLRDVGQIVDGTWDRSAELDGV
jgi:hypothetical protein